MDDKRFRTLLAKTFNKALVTPDGVRDAAILFAFKAGYSPLSLAQKFHLKKSEVHEIIRSYMK